MVEYKNEYKIDLEIALPSFMVYFRYSSDVYSIVHHKSAHQIYVDWIVAEAIYRPWSFAAVNRSNLHNHLAFYFFYPHWDPSNDDMFQRP